MPVSDSIKKKATQLANKSLAKEENNKSEKLVSSVDQIATLEKKIAALKESGNFESTIKRLEGQILQIKNKKRNLLK